MTTVPASTSSTIVVTEQTRLAAVEIAGRFYDAVLARDGFAVASLGTDPPATIQEELDDWASAIGLAGGSFVVIRNRFTETTAERLNTTLPELAAMSEETQMAWVQLYLERVASGTWPDDRRPMPLNTQQRLYMSVFYPEARDWPLSTKFPAKVQKQNPGIVTVNDYIAGVNRLGKLSHLVGKEAA